MTKKGTIVGFSGSWGSGLGTLTLEEDQVFCDNGATVRALAEAFGEEVYGEGHTVNQEAICGKQIYYDVDFMNVLDGFTPAEEWTGPEPEEEM